MTISNDPTCSLVQCSWHLVFPTYDLNYIYFYVGKRKFIATRALFQLYAFTDCWISFIDEAIVSLFSCIVCLSARPHSKSITHCVDSSRCGGDSSTGQTVQEARPGRLRLDLGRGVHGPPRTSTEPTRTLPSRSFPFSCLSFPALPCYLMSLFSGASSLNP